MPSLTLPPTPESAATRAEATRAGAASGVHDAVCGSLRVTTDAQRTSLRALRTGAAVVTGQQAGLFGGPLYTVYKAAAAVVNARALGEETGVPCAPVFWLQNEDHDFDEIARATVLGWNGRLTVTHIERLAEADGCSVGARPLGPSVDDALDRLDDALHGAPHAGEVRSLHRACWSHDVSPSAAFARWIERLFSRHGLLVVDPAHPDLVAAARPVHDAARRRADALATALGAQADALRAAERPAPVHVRPGAPLSFFHPTGALGPRFRVAPAGPGAYRWIGREGTVTSEELGRLHATTSALLRPLLQDLLLPTAAYVGGPGERAYLAQLPPLWGAFDRPMPMVVPRARFRWIDAKARKRATQLGLTPDDLARPRHELLERIAPAPTDGTLPDALADEVAAHAEERLAAFADEAATLDPGLARSAHRVREAVRYHADRLAARYRRTLSRQSDVATARLDALCARLQPAGGPQERTLVAASPMAWVGVDAFVDAVLASVRPFDGTLHDLELG